MSNPRKRPRSQYRGRSQGSTAHSRIMDAIEYTTKRDGRAPAASTIKQRINTKEKVGMTQNQVSNHLGMLKREGRIVASNDKQPTYRIVPGRRYSRKFTEPIPISNTLNFVGIGIDRNGNKIARFKPTDPRMGRGFSIQTNGNLPMAHSIPNEASLITYPAAARRQLSNEVRTYIGMYGTNRQNRLTGQIGNRALERGYRGARRG